MTTAAPHPSLADGLAATAARIAAGELTSVQAVAGALERIDAAQPTLNAFRCVRRDLALEEAAAADARHAAGERAPLLGVPIAVKDDVDLAGETTAFGCDGPFVVKDADSEVVRRLRAAGAVIVGKTTTPELGQWPITDSTACGPTRNPWNLDHTPGGSSGGAAAAVAAGLVPGALGSDGAGSVRIPAAWTGLVGIKPQRGRISTWPDAEAFGGLTCFGPLARTVEDAALLLDCAQGNAPGDRHTPPPAETPFVDAARAAAPGRLRIGLSFRIPFSGAPARLSRGIRARVERLAGVLRELGHEVVRADPSYGLVGLSFMPRSMDGLRDWTARMPDGTEMDPRTRHNAVLGRRLRPLLPLARLAETPLQWQMGRVFESVDVVLAPTTAKPPLKVGAIDRLGAWETDKVVVGACPYAWPWNVVGWPGVNVPAGLVDGLPVGASLLGPANSEALLIGLAAQLETVERWQDRRPA